jgi:hypothetical protein
MTRSTISTLRAEMVMLQEEEPLVEEEQAVDMARRALRLRRKHAVAFATKRVPVLIRLVKSQIPLHARRRAVRWATRATSAGETLSGRESHDVEG